MIYKPFEHTVANWDFITEEWDITIVLEICQIEDFQVEFILCT